MNPHDFQASVLAWLVVIVALASPAAHAYFAIRKAWNDEKEKAELQKQLALQKQQTEQNTARLNGQSQKIDTLCCKRLRR